MTARSKIALVGFTASREDAPWDDPEWAVYGCNNLWAQPGMGDKWPKCEGWYDLHDSATITGDGLPDGPAKTAAQAHTQWLREGHLPCFVMPSARQSDWPKALDFPRDRILKWAGEFAGRRYFTNSVSWMVAHAIMELVDAGAADAEIALYGIDMAQAGEYCVSPETRVLTADLRWVPASTVQVGDEIISFDEYPQEGRRRWRKAVVEEANVLTRPCYRLHMEDGSKLVSSVEHRWMAHACNDCRWMTTEQLQSAESHPDRPSRIVKVAETWDDFDAHSRDAGYLAAAFDGEGHLSQRFDPGLPNGTGTAMSLGFAQRENAMSRAVEDALHRFGFKFGYSDQDCRKYAIRGGRAEMLRFLGTVRPPRLLDKFDPDLIGELSRLENVAVLEKEHIGDQPVIGLKTTTGTFIAEGFASHNSSQRPSCEYWLGIAEGLGVKVTVAPRADLLKCAFLYGSEDGSDFALKMRSRQFELQTRAQDLANQAEQLRGQLEQVVGMQNQLHGALDDVNYVIDVWLQPEGTRQGGDDPSISSTASEPLLQVVPDG